MEVEAENVRVYWVSDWLIWGRGLAIGQLDTREVILWNYCESNAIINLDYTVIFNSLDVGCIRSLLWI